MEESLISFDTAVFAKEKGYSVGNRRSYVIYKDSYDYDDDPNHRESYKKGDIHLDGDFYMMNGREDIGDISNELYDLYEAPTQSLLQQHLLEKHGIHIELSFDDGKWSIYVGEFSYPDCSVEFVASVECDSFEDAIIKKKEAKEIGLQEGLKLIEL